MGQQFVALLHQFYSIYFLFYQFVLTVPWSLVYTGHETAQKLHQIVLKQYQKLLKCFHGCACCPKLPPVATIALTAFSAVCLCDIVVFSGYLIMAHQKPMDASKYLSENPSMDVITSISICTSFERNSRVSIAFTWPSVCVLWLSGEKAIRPDKRQVQHGRPNERFTNKHIDTHHALLAHWHT